MIKRKLYQHVPVYDRFSMEQQSARYCASASSTSSDETVCCNVFNFKKGDLVKSGFYRTKLFDNVVCCGCGWESGTRKLSLKHINIVHKLANPDCKMSKNINLEFKNLGNFKRSVNEMENVMRESFLAYPKTYPDIEKMVQAGFYYTGVDDAIMCVSCGLMLDEWKPNEDPWKEHDKNSPFCDLL